ncbi:conserved hypothetical protein [Frankia sp. AiPs1]|uniref:hypothetical protein n=1 Tax=Frankia sp. AiPa1 TaxID=573492 RepID=UPI00202B6BDF|nr:hypothetical protein [Frankia sp. AiPa1]MCL9758665.1 hypothetical protein [Frankia sp. AiPa1]
MPVSDPDRDGGAVVPAGRPTTVWPYPPEGPGRPSAGWLAAALDQLVTCYTRPGDPVLILIPPHADMPAAGRHGTPADRLADAGGAVDRLGRAVQVRSASAAGPAQPSGYGPRAQGEGPDGDRRPLVVTVVDPTRTGWVHGVPWDRLVAPGGMLAVITRSESIAGGLLDPTGALVAATGRYGLALLDRLVLLEIPIAELGGPPTTLAHQVVARRVHSDLLLFVLPTGPRERR